MHQLSALFIFENEPLPESVNTFNDIISAFGTIPGNWVSELAIIPETWVPWPLPSFPDNFVPVKSTDATILSEIPLPSTSVPKWEWSTSIPVSKTTTDVPEPSYLLKISSLSPICERYALW